ncbi:MULTISPECIES: hypothetical protein [Kingella]|uniref:Uncharacterized protein n=1 Tax=Kingella bonacorsii TaxID=2796361 RepID=A0ABS1BV82_9NEIS|nr:hypothetical protein [Kingella bonacorsii]MBK0397202.1 hypothetical protein [Kingella bonacorsii]
MGLRWVGFYHVNKGSLKRMMGFQAAFGRWDRIAKYLRQPENAKIHFQAAYPHR